MKKLCLLLLTLSFLAVNGHSQLLKKLGDKIKDKTNQRVDQKTDQTIDKGLDKTEDATKKKDGNSTSSANTNTNSSNETPDSPAAPPTLKVYANYDFVPGDTVLFEDNFMDDQDGEFPSHWGLEAGQGILNKMNSIPAFFLTEGNYVRVSPRMKVEKNYIPANFTVEFDFYANSGYSPLILFQMEEGGDRNIQFGEDVSTGYFTKDFSSPYPGDREHFRDKWHHAALVKKGSQIKCYVDQYRVLVMPDCGVFKPVSLQVGGIGDATNPIIFKNFRLASGGGMNMIGKKFTESKIVTHGINFDVDKATIKPESMGTLNMIVQVMKDNADIKFEVDGHTDNIGAAAHNLTLSQQRADAVKDQLVKMGIDASRLTTKGFGDTKPVSDNTTLEGKANNRRVEFVKM
ncbi:MAG: OmpA family protein [Bacteroidota bacterium]|nr:OmpA family protein [Bacteroidota bacterium]